MEFCSGHIDMERFQRIASYNQPSSNRSPETWHFVFFFWLKISAPCVFFPEAADAKWWMMISGAKICIKKNSDKNEGHGENKHVSPRFCRFPPISFSSERKVG